MGDTGEEVKLVFPLDIPEAQGKESIVHAKERPPSKPITWHIQGSRWQKLG